MAGVMAERRLAAVYGSARASSASDDTGCFGWQRIGAVRGNTAGTVSQSFGRPGFDRRVIRCRTGGCVSDRHGVLVVKPCACLAVANDGLCRCTAGHTDAQLRELTFWNLGSVAQATAEQIAVTLPCLILVWLTIPWLARPLNALLLGEAVAGHLGFSVERVKRVAIFSVALSVGAAVSVSGLIGFVGLVAPHRLLLPASALLGAVLLITADTIARTIVAPAELPIGLVMALMGGPFFLFLLMQRRR